MYKNINDYEQLYLVKENDDDAKIKIFNKYKPIIVSIAKKYHDYTNNRFDIEDLIQEGYIGLDRAISSFDDNAGVLFYTFSIICIERQIKSYYRSYNTLKNYYNYNSISLDMEIDNMYISDIIEDRTLENNPEIVTDTSEFFSKLIDFKHTLGFEHSLIFELRYNGFKYKEISQLLDLSVSFIDNSIHHCKEKLRLYLK